MSVGLFVASFMNVIFLFHNVEQIGAFNISFNPSSVKVTEDKEVRVNFTWLDKPSDYNVALTVVAADRDVATVDRNKFYSNETSDDYFIVKGIFLGHTHINICERQFENGTIIECTKIHVTVAKKERAITTAFVISVAVLISLNYINMGCALDLKVVKEVLLKPIGPILGFFCQYLLMPLVAYGVGQLLFESSILQLGLFTFGCSPGGGASNMWTVLLNGNLNLSLTMTFISTIAALGMMPLWLFTLGKTFYTTTEVPFQNIFTSLIAMIAPVGIGILLQRYLPRVTKFCRRILAPVSILLILFIIAFGIYANLYMFKLFDWKIVIAASMNVWLGFAVSALACKLIGMPAEDLIAISVETGVQNTGIAYVLLSNSLRSPDSDIASVVPIAGSIVTPIPLLLIYCYIKSRDCLFRSKNLKLKGVVDDEKKQIIPRKETYLAK